MVAAHLSTGEAAVTINVINGPIIPKDGTLSNAVDCKTWTIIRIFIPPEWSSAPLTFLLSPDDVLPYATVCLANGKERVITAQPNSIILGSILPGGFIKFRSGTNAKQIPQRNACQFRIALEV